MLAILVLHAYALVARVSQQDFEIQCDFRALSPRLLSRRLQLRLLHLPVLSDSTTVYEVSCSQRTIVAYQNALLCFVSFAIHRSLCEHIVAVP
jgi:hypothetical protein